MTACGPAVQRLTSKRAQRYFRSWLQGLSFSVVPNSTGEQPVSTFDHPIQSFVWDDFTAKEDRTWTNISFIRSKASQKNDRSAAPIPITVRTEPLFSKKEHDVFFNRGVASSVSPFGVSSMNLMTASSR